MEVVFNKKTNKLEILGKLGRSKLQKFLILKALKNANGAISENLITYINSFSKQIREREFVLKHRLLRTYVENFLDQSPNLLENKRSNSILELYNKRMNLSANHVPQNKHQDNVGVEIECFIPYKSIQMIQSDNTEDCDNCCGTGEVQCCVGSDDEGNPAFENYSCGDCDGTGEVEGDSGRPLIKLKELFKSRKVTFTQIKSDGSIEPDDGYFGCEVTVLTRQGDSSNLMKVCNLLSELGAKVNKTCGLHVHLDARHLDAEEVIELGNKFKKALPVMLDMVPKSRRDNHYCKAEVSTLDGDRYSAINLTAYDKFQTVEIRLHSGTTDYTKIMNWVNFCNAIAKSKIFKKCKDINQLTEYVNIDQDLLEYIGQRTALFSSKQDCTNEVMKDNDSTDPVELITDERIEQVRRSLYSPNSIASLTDNEIDFVCRNLIDIMDNYQINFNESLQRFSARGNYLFSEHLIGIFSSTVLEMIRNRAQVGA